MKLSLRSVMVCVATLLCLGSGVQTFAGTAHHQSGESIVIPGPLRSFLRMSGVSQEVSLDEVLPTLARNISLLGFQNGRETEFLVLLNRYVHQARELAEIADAKGEIRVASCDDAGRLIGVLGYRLQGVCGQRHTRLMTADPERAFLTIDSGFPLTLLEQ